MPFNIFKVLEKDDKELIHSAFIKYLFKYHGEFFYPHLLGIENLDFKTPKLEVSYERKRIDIEILSNDESNIIVIENKFKSFPYSQQLTQYDDIYERKHAEKQKYKFLFCFDPEMVQFNNENWTIFSYEQLLDNINRFISQSNEIEDDQIKFINHYQYFLKEYYDELKTIQNNLRPALENPDEGQNKFWLQLVNSIIRIKIEQIFIRKEIPVVFNVNPGAAKAPLLNIIPERWKDNEVERLIQFQGRDSKFYIHTNKRSVVRKSIKLVSDNMNIEDGELKSLNKRRTNSCFIYKENILERIPRDITIDSIVAYLISFYYKIYNIIENSH